MNRQTRREFLTKGFSGVALAGAGFIAPPLLSFAGEPGQSVTPTATNRSYTAGKYAMELNGQLAGWIYSAEGGHATSDVVVQPVGADRVQTKHIGGITYEPITVKFGNGMSTTYYQWIQATLAGQPARQNGAIVTCDYNFNEQSRLEWLNAIVTEIGFPACDAASKDAAMMTLKFAPEQTRILGKATGTIGTRYKGSAVVQKKWLPSNFRLKIDGLDCSKVSRIEAITASVRSATGPTSLAIAQHAAAPLQQISNLVVTLAEASAETFYAWYKASIIQGNTAQAQKSGQLEYLSPDLTNAIFALTFPRLTILKWTPLPAPVGVTTVRTVQIQMACASLGFAWNAAA
jgi:T4-like virus tail tube protein gp19